jgi:hypothetical protein
MSMAHWPNTGTRKPKHSREIPVTVPLSPLQIPCRILENHNTPRFYDNIRLQNSVPLNAINIRRKHFISIIYTSESGGL